MDVNDDGDDDNDKNSDPDCLKIIDEFENHHDDQDYLKCNSNFFLFYKSEFLISFSVHNFNYQ